MRIWSSGGMVLKVSGLEDRVGDGILLGALWSSRDSFGGYGKDDSWLVESSEWWKIVYSLDSQLMVSTTSKVISLYCESYSLIYAVSRFDMFSHHMQLHAEFWYQGESYQDMFSQIGPNHWVVARDASWRRFTAVMTTGYKEHGRQMKTAIQWISICSSVLLNIYRKTRVIIPQNTLLQNPT